MGVKMRLYSLCSICTHTASSINVENLWHWCESLQFVRSTYHWHLREKKYNMNISKPSLDSMPSLVIFAGCTCYFLLSRFATYRIFFSSIFMVEKMSRLFNLIFFFLSGSIIYNCSTMQGHFFRFVILKWIWAI